MKKYLPYIIVGVLVIIIIVVSYKRFAKKNRTPDQLKADHLKNCASGTWWKSDAAYKEGYYIPLDDPNFNGRGFDEATETCDLLGWMVEINMAKNRGVRWTGTDTMLGLANAAAFQLAEQKGRK